MTEFGKWLQTFVAEKGIDLGDCVAAKCGGPVQVGDVIQAMMGAPPSEQKAIKNAFVVIDYSDGDVLKFIAHLAKATTAAGFRQMTADAFGID